jgi:hypothetical protein
MNENLKEKQKEKIFIQPFYIANIKAPDEELQLLAVGLDPFTIGNISKQSEKAQILAVSMHEETVALLRNPTLKVILYILNDLKLPLSSLKKSWIKKIPAPIRNKYIKNNNIKYILD